MIGFIRTFSHWRGGVFAYAFRRRMQSLVMNSPMF